jgi:hypothetical protein
MESTAKMTAMRPMMNVVDVNTVAVQSLKIPRPFDQES